MSIMGDVDVIDVIEYCKNVIKYYKNAVKYYKNAEKCRCVVADRLTYIISTFTDIVSVV